MTEYELEPTIHYTDAEKIKRLTAWHESEKAEIATLRAEVEKLKGEKSDLQHDIDYMIAQNVESIQAVMTQYDKALGTVKQQAAQIATLESLLAAARMYLNHPDVRAIPFAMRSEVLAEKIRTRLAKAPPTGTGY